MPGGGNMSRKKEDYRQCRLRKPGTTPGSFTYMVSWIPVDGAVAGKRVQLIEKGSGETLDGIWEVESAGSEIRKFEDIISHDTKSYFPSLGD